MPYSDPEKRRDYGREWMRRNPDKAREAMRRWRAKHPEEKRVQQREYYRRNPERVQRTTDASPNRKTVRKLVDQRRRAQRIAGGGNVTVAEWLALLAARGHRCAYCGTGILPLQMDHRVPLTRGGAHSIENILPACGPCNMRKSARTEAEFRRLIDPRSNGPESSYT